ncbi:uncharacterized protein LOC141900241 [Tubulanus polymorphus]|uniref:uncharacterized protein LOC141900241 n=1 Tax=Tubulanus polymorphus TaxID=672921 RepID=UPI003DA39CE3
MIGVYSANQRQSWMKSVSKIVKDEPESICSETDCCNTQASHFGIDPEEITDYAKRSKTTDSLDIVAEQNDVAAYDTFQWQINNSADTAMAMDTWMAPGALPHIAPWQNTMAPASQWVPTTCSVLTQPQNNQLHTSMPVFVTSLAASSQTMKETHVQISPAPTLSNNVPSVCEQSTAVSHQPTASCSNQFSRKDGSSLRLHNIQAKKDSPHIKQMAQQNSKDPRLKKVMDALANIKSNAKTKSQTLDSNSAVNSASNDEEASKRKRFLRTAHELEQSGLLKYTIQTANLIHENEKTQREINALNIETNKLLQSILDNPENAHILSSILSQKLEPWYGIYTNTQ